jgi:hypothetical protein
MKNLMLMTKKSLTWNDEEEFDVEDEEELGDETDDVEYDIEMDDEDESEEKKTKKKKKMIIGSDEVSEEEDELEENRLVRWWVKLENSWYWHSKR